MVRFGFGKALGSLNVVGAALALAGVLLLAGCASSSGAAVPSGGSGQGSGSSAAAPSASASSSASASASSSSSSSAARTATYQLLDRAEYGEVNHEFSEGRAWVEFEKDGDAYLGVIDESGELVYQVDLDGLFKEAQAADTGMAAVNYANVVRTARFQDGVSYYGPGRAGVDYAGAGFVIVDEDGNELFDSDDGDEATELTMLGFADGVFVVLEHLYDMSHDDYSVYAIDPTGKKLTDEFAVEHPGVDGAAGFECYADGVFSNGWYILDVNGNKLLDAGDSSTNGVAPRTTFYQGKALSYGTIVSLDDFASQEAVDSLRERLQEPDFDFSSNKYHISLSYFEEEPYASWGEGLFFSTAHDGDLNGYAGWFSIDGDLAVPAPDYGEGVSIEAAGNFSGGCAPVQLHGKDGEEYVTAVDERGEELFTPVKGQLCQSSSANGPRMCQDGFFAVSLANQEDNGPYGFAVLDSTGKVYKVGVDDLSALGDGAYLQLSWWSAVSEGWAFYRDSSDKSKGSASRGSYLSLDGKRTIDACYE